MIKIQVLKNINFLYAVILLCSMIIMKMVIYIKDCLRVSIRFDFFYYYFFNYFWDRYQTTIFYRIIFYYKIMLTIYIIYDI
jgi:hypothetical protein